MTNTLLEIIFGNPDELKNKVYWELYSPVHLIWLGAIAVVCILACLKFRKLPYQRKSNILKNLAIWIFIQEIIKDILYWLTGAFSLDILPFHICGISIAFCIWYGFLPGKLNGAYIYGVCLPGALAALIFCDWTNLPWYNFSSINSFTIHGELVLFSLLALTSGMLKPDYRQIPKMTLFMYLIAIPIYFLNKLWDTNFMFINYPSPGSPLIPLYDLFGNGYVIAAAILLVVIWVILFLPWLFLCRGQSQEHPNK